MAIPSRRTILIACTIRIFILTWNRASSTGIIHILPKPSPGTSPYFVQPAVSVVLLQHVPHHQANVHQEPVFRQTPLQESKEFTRTPLRNQPAARPSQRPQATTFAESRSSRFEASSSFQQSWRKRPGEPLEIASQGQRAMKHEAEQRQSATWTPGFGEPVSEKNTSSKQVYTAEAHVRRNSTLPDHRSEVQEPRAGTTGQVAPFGTITQLQHDQCLDCNAVKHSSPTAATDQLVGQPNGPPGVQWTTAAERDAYPVSLYKPPSIAREPPWVRGDDRAPPGHRLGGPGRGNQRGHQKKKDGHRPPGQPDFEESSNVEGEYEFSGPSGHGRQPSHRPPSQPAFPGDYPDRPYPTDHPPHRQRPHIPPAGGPHPHEPYPQDSYPSNPYPDDSYPTSEERPQRPLHRPQPPIRPQRLPPADGQVRDPYPESPRPQGPLHQPEPTFRPQGIPLVDEQVREPYPDSASRPQRPHHRPGPTLRPQRLPAQDQNVRDTYPESEPRPQRPHNWQEPTLRPGRLPSPNEEIRDPYPESSSKPQRPHHRPGPTVPQQGLQPSDGHVTDPYPESPSRPQRPQHRPETTLPPQRQPPSGEHVRHPYPHSTSRPQIPLHRPNPTSRPLPSEEPGDSFLESRPQRPHHRPKPILQPERLPPPGQQVRDPYPETAPGPQRPHHRPGTTPRPQRLPPLGEVRDPYPESTSRPQSPLQRPQSTHRPQGQADERVGSLRDPSPQSQVAGTRPSGHDDERPIWPAHPDLRKLQPLCGVRSLTFAETKSSDYQTVPFIVGGKATKHSSWPWMARLELINADEVTYKFLCGGSLITARYILTAAHCFSPVPERVQNYKIVFFSPRPGRTVERYVEKISIHENYTSYSHYYDIAAIRFDRNLLKPFMPICLPHATLSPTYLTGKMANVIGWGSTKFGGPSSKELREVTVPIWSNEECSRVFNPLRSQHIDKGIVETQLCAGPQEGGADACQGDSGGPLMYLDETNKWALVGVVSFGHSCGSPGYPGVYTRMPSYLDWIKEHVNFTA